MTDYDMIELSRAIDNLATNVRDGAERISEALAEIDITLQQRLESEPDPPAVSELVERIGQLGVRALQEAIESWETKKAG